MGACYQAHRRPALLRNCMSSLTASKLFVEGGEVIDDAIRSLILLFGGRGRGPDPPQLIPVAVGWVVCKWGVPVRSSRAVDLAPRPCAGGSD
jgi:hypothetical protein